MFLNCKPASCGLASVETRVGLLCMHCVVCRDDSIGMITSEGPAAMSTKPTSAAGPVQVPLEHKFSPYEMNGGCVAFASVLALVLPPRIHYD